MSNEVSKRMPRSERCLLSQDISNNLQLILSHCDSQLKSLDCRSEAAAHCRIIREAATYMVERIATSPCPLCVRTQRYNARLNEVAKECQTST